MTLSRALCGVLRACTRHLERRAYLRPQRPSATPRSVSQDIPGPLYLNR